MAVVSHAPAPIGEINMTPLIDVLLVLLVMFLLALPVMTHKVPLDLPGEGPGETAAPHRLDITAQGAILWNGAAVPTGSLRSRLEALAVDPYAPPLAIAADEAVRYERVDRVLAETARAGVTRIGFVGNDRFADAF